jgi:Rad3-related DNA helicase
MAADSHGREPFLLIRQILADGPRYLALDARRPQRILTLTSTEQPPAETASALLLVDEPLARVQRLRGGGLRVSRRMLWCLLDPVRASAEGPWSPIDGVAAEQALRAEGARLWQRLAWWGSLPQSERGDCLELLRRHVPTVALLGVRLERLAGAAGADPFSGWPGGSPSTAGAAPPQEWEQPPHDPEQLVRWFQAATGLGRLYGADFRPRAEQAQMAAEVARSLQDGVPMLVEAGTGVGKTLAYLVPLLSCLAAGEQRGIVATHTRTLQRQLLERDLPLLLHLYPRQRVRLLMGRRNYLCARQRQTFLARPVRTSADALAAVCFRLWLLATEDGQREELAEHPVLGEHVGALFDTVDPCAPILCRDGCFVQRARRLAREAALLVVNHALLLRDLRAEHTLIGPYDRLVVDEAHRLPQAVLEESTIRCDAGRAAILGELLGPVEGPLPARLRELMAQLAVAQDGGRDAADLVGDFWRALQSVLAAYDAWWRAMEDAFAGWVGDGSHPSGRLRVGDPDEAFAPLRAQTDLLLAACGETLNVYARLARRCENLSTLSVGEEDFLASLARCGQLLDGLQADVRFLTGGADEDWVRWAEPRARGGLHALGMTPLLPGEMLRALWQESGLCPVATSATLAVGDDFTHMLTELGLDRHHPRTRTVLVASPFDFARQALFLTAPGLPAPEEAGYEAAIAALLRRLRREVPRRTLVLFTSYQTLTRVADDLDDRTGERDLFVAPARQAGTQEMPAVLVQRSADETGPLLVDFRRRGGALLLGTASFWEGVDFPGPELEVLVVTKLPFLVPADPWVAAKCERIQAGGENPFATFMLREAVLRLRQGVGRLIRSQGDRGVVVLLDSRLHTRRYGVTFLKALPVLARPCASEEEIVAATAEFLGTTPARAGATGPEGESLHDTRH